MSSAIRVAASGARAHQIRLDVVGHNLSNVNTPGFKATRTDFQDDRYIELRAARPGREAGAGDRAGSWLGTGVIVATRPIFAQGPIEITDQSLDLAIVGNGFFQVRHPDGSLAYTRSGAFRVDPQGRMVTAHGYLLEPPIQAPAGVAELKVDPEGIVSARVGREGAPVRLGTLALSTFPNPEGLESRGFGIYVASEKSGQPTTVPAGQGGNGSIVAGALERSNVDLEGQMVALVEAQRAYQLSLKAVQALIEMTQEAVDLQRL
ncbi:MAG: flagellar hook-basal body complex protein [Chloroflexi bacterium]|nr:flagellar hook-basal body complex protein [Chloroflexota bacterium]